jgi:hypothetical protein
VPRSGDATLFFTDDDFIWVEPALETAPTVAVALPAPGRLRPARRRQTRTLAGDLARLRAGVAAQTAALPPRARVVLAACLLAALCVLALVVISGSGDRSSRQASPARSKEGQTPLKGAPGDAPPLRALKAGDEGPGVADLQRAFGALGLYSQAVDGVFGDSTGAAVLAFQSEHGLVPDGIAGPTTIQALVETLAEGAKNDAAVARDGLTSAVAAGRLSAASAKRYRSVVASSLEQLRALPPGRVPTLALVFDSVAAAASEYDEPRALTLFSMLKANADYLTKHAPPTATFTDIEDADGIVYRFLPQHGFQFHPIADFARLNKLARNGKTEAVRRLADALVARGIRSGDALLWEYYFPFGGPAHWTSGFAQATAAQALARSADLLDDAKLEDAARAAFRGIARGLWLDVAGGLWVREYGFSDMPILNAQLQAIISLSDYAELADDDGARAAVAKMEAATRGVLAQFDTGCWSRYSLGGSPASLHYHKYHVRLLKQLGAETGDPLWSETAARWDGYLSSGGPTAC